eukprot:5944052-Pleurochrysis_carterae.AAC.2
MKRRLYASKELSYEVNTRSRDLHDLRSPTICACLKLQDPRDLSTEFARPDSSSQTQEMSSLDWHASGNRPTELLGGLHLVEEANVVLLGETRLGVAQLLRRGPTSADASRASTECRARTETETRHVQLTRGAAI